MEKEEQPISPWGDPSKNPEYLKNLVAFTGHFADIPGINHDLDYEAEELRLFVDVVKRLKELRAVKLEEEKKAKESVEHMIHEIEAQGYAVFLRTAIIRLDDEEHPYFLRYQIQLKKWTSGGPVFFEDGSFQHDFQAPTPLFPDRNDLDGWTSEICRELRSPFEEVLCRLSYLESQRKEG